MRFNPTLIGIFLFAILLQTSTNRTIQVPNQKSDETLLMRLQQLYIADRVFSIFGPLDKIYKKQAIEISQKTERPFPYCFENPPEVTFKVNGEHRIGLKNYNRGGVVYNFDQIKYPRNLIDIEIQNNRIYYVLEDGIIKIASLSPDLKEIEETKEYQTEETKIAFGIIVILPDLTYNGVTGYGVFVTQSQVTLFDLEGKSFKSMTNLEQMGEFATAISIEGKYIATALGGRGVKIFSLDFEGNMLKLETKVDQQTFKLKSIDVQDLAYDSARKNLFILDSLSGVLPLALAFAGEKLSAAPTSSVISLKDCNLLYYDAYQDELYINCRQLYKKKLSKWPVVQNTILPQQQISIRQITSSNETVALVGRNIFEVINLERKVAIYQDRLLDKLILKDGKFVSGNENYILTGHFSIDPPNLSCQAMKDSAVGKHNVLFKVTAECNQEYLNKVGFNPGNIEKDDKCVYTVYHKVKIWKPAALNVKVFGIIALIIGIMSLGVLFWWSCSFINLRKLQNQWQNYHVLNEGQDAQMSSDSSQKPPEVELQMKPELISKGIDKDGRQELHEQVDIPANLHDIE